MKRKRIKLELEDAGKEARLLETNPADDLSTTNSPSSSSSSSSSVSSSSLEKFRLQCAMEHALQYDLRLQEIVKRHELERQYVRKKHRYQWIELEKSLTLRYGEEWKTCVGLQDLSFISTFPGGIASGFEDFTDARQQNRQNDDDDVNSATLNGQTAETLETIREGQIEDYFANDIAGNESKSTLSFFVHQGGRSPLLPNDCARPGPSVVTTDDLVSRRNSDVSIESSRQKLRAWQGALGQTERRKSVQPNVVVEPTESRLSHNIANSLAKKSQCPVVILDPNSSRLHHRHHQIGPKEDAAAIGLKTENPTGVGQTLTALPQPVQTLQNQNYVQSNGNTSFSQLYRQNLIQNLLLANVAETNPPGCGFDLAAWARAIEEDPIAREALRSENGSDLWTLLMAANRISDAIAGEQASQYSQIPDEENHPNESSSVQLNRHYSELQEPPPRALPPFQTPVVGFPYSILSQSPQQTASRIGWEMTPGVGLTGFAHNPLLPNERPTYNLQELGPQILAFPYTATNHSIYSLLGLHDYGEPM